MKEVKKYKCKKCGERFICKRNYLTHIRKHEKENV